MSTDIPILLYHSVHDEPPERFRPWAVGRELFAEHMGVLVNHGYTGLSIGELTDLIRTGSRIPEKTVVVTFDDGFADFALNAWPVMKSGGIPATLYVTAGTVGGRSEWLESMGAGEQSMLDPEEIRKLADDGVEIGAHSMTHPQLDCVGRDEARREILESKLALEAILERPVDSFAYPHGYHDRAVKNMVVEAGYTSAAAVRNALSHAEDDRFALARFTVMGDCSAERLAGVLRGEEIGRAHPKERLRTSMWRQVRKYRSRKSRRFSDE